MLVDNREVSNFMGYSKYKPAIEFWMVLKPEAGVLKIGAVWGMSKYVQLSVPTANVLFTNKQLVIQLCKIQSKTANSQTSILNVGFFKTTHDQAQTSISSF